MEWAVAECQILQRPFFCAQILFSDGGRSFEIQSEEQTIAHYPQNAGLPIIWAGDYADDEPYTLNGNKVTIYSLTDDVKSIKGITPKHYRYVINEDKKQFIDTNKIKADNYGYKIHPLPLLCADGNGRGNGDFYGKNSKRVGSWKRNVVVVSDIRPDESYKEITINFVEE